MNKTKSIEHQGVQVEAIDLSPSFPAKLAIVHYDVIKKLTAHLPSVPFHRIKSDVIDRLSICDNLNDMIQIMHDEIAFHETVNIINEYERQNQRAPKPARFELDSNLE